MKTPVCSHCATQPSALQQIVHLVLGARQARDNVSYTPANERPLPPSYLAQLGSATAIDNTPQTLTKLMQNSS